MTEKKPLIVLAGSTAVGKTALSIRLAREIDGAVISADSMQVYRGMDIGSAKVRPEERAGVPHYLIDILDPKEEFHVVRFQEAAKRALDEIYDNGQIPIVAGGTGFYIQALLYDIDFTEQDDDPGLREAYERIAKEQGAHALHEKLRAIDPDAADAIHENNIRRTIRALEFYEKSGQPISAHNAAERRKESPYRFCYFVLNAPREKLYAAIDERVDRMIEAGLLEEVKTLREGGCRRDMVSMQGLGYKELFAYLDGEISYEEAVYRIKRDTRHFAKRQLTWFRRERDVIWVEKEDFAFDDEAILAYLLHVLKEKQILPAAET